METKPSVGAIEAAKSASRWLEMANNEQHCLAEIIDRDAVHPAIAELVGALREALERIPWFADDGEGGSWNIDENIALCKRIETLIAKHTTTLEVT